MPFQIEDDCILVKYKEIWNRIKNMLNMKFHSKSVYDKKYIKAKIKILSDMVNTIFWSDKIPEEIVHFICILIISIDSVKMDKKNYPRVCLMNANVT